MPAPLSIPRERSKRGLRLPFGDRDGPDAGHLEELADVRFCFPDAGVPFAPDAEGRLEDRDRRGDRAPALSKTSANASAFTSRVSMATIAEASTNQGSALSSS
jgi:hypothetical protein